MDTPIFHIKNLNCKYPTSKRSVLEVSELSIKENSIVFFVGPSGVGKSTILETLGLMNNTIEQNINGSEFTFYDGNNEIDLIRVWKERRRENTLSKIRNHHFSFLFQENNLFPSLTGYQNAIAGGIVQGKTSHQSRSDARKIFNEILKDLNTKDSDFKITEMSGGQRQRLSFVRAILSEYKVLFADEPTGNLDWFNAELLMRYLTDQTKKKDQSNAAIIVSHDIDLALKFADTIIYIDKKSYVDDLGRTQYYGEINNSTIYNRKSNTWIAEDQSFTTKELDHLIREKFKSHS